jgi:hypothetical protein
LVWPSDAHQQKPRTCCGSSWGTQTTRSTAR